jgi:hypothetical protein
MKCLTVFPIARRRACDSSAHSSWPYPRRFFVELPVSCVATFDRTSSRWFAILRRASAPIQWSLLMWSALVRYDGRVLQTYVYL